MPGERPGNRERLPILSRALWQVIDQDSHCQFPDYQGEKMTVQDRWVAFEKRYVQDAVRSLLRKMNIEIVELEKNLEKLHFVA